MLNGLQLQPIAELELALLLGPHLYSRPLHVASDTIALHTFIPGDTLSGKPPHRRTVYAGLLAGIWTSVDKSWSQQIGCESSTG